MTTISICVTKNNVNGLTPYIKRNVRKIVDFTEKERFFTVTALSDGAKNEFIFDKKDFRLISDVFRTITDIVRVA